MKNATLLLALILLALTSTAGAGEGPLPLGVSFVSPNGRYSVHLEEIDGEPHFVIVEKRTNQVDNSIEMPTRLLYLHWAVDSNSFVTVEHIAKGSYGRVIYLKEKKWRSLQVLPPYDGRMDASIIRLEMNADYVHYRFAVTKLTDNWMPSDHRLCDLDVKLDTGETFNVGWTPVNDVAAVSKLMQNPVYLPLMDYKGQHER